MPGRIALYGKFSARKWERAWALVPTDWDQIDQERPWNARFDTTFHCMLCGVNPVVVFMLNIDPVRDVHDDPAGQARIILSGNTAKGCRN